MWTARASSLSGWRRRPFWSAWSHVLHKGGPTRLLRRGRHDARAPKIMSDGRRASRGQPRTPAEVLQRVWWAGDGKGGDGSAPSLGLGPCLQLLDDVDSIHRYTVA